MKAQQTICEKHGGFDYCNAAKTSHSQSVETKPTATEKASPDYRNPLPCGCGRMGTPQLNGYGYEYELRQEYVKQFIKFCPLHAAAPQLYEALKAILTEAEFVAEAKAPFSTWVAEKARAALSLIEN